MKKRIVHRLPIPLAHVTSVHHDDAPPKIIQGEDLAKSLRLRKKDSSLRSLSPPNTLFRGSNYLQKKPKSNRRI